VLLDRRFDLDRGRTFALYVMLYTAGRFVIETMRTDTANLIFGHRLNEWTAVLVFLGGLVLFLVQTRKTRASRTTSQDADDIPETQDV
jgi:prolipoprotein diacylglyceryltransferase